MFDKYEASEIVGGSLLLLLSIWRVIVSDQWIDTFIPGFLASFGFQILVGLSLVGMVIGALMIAGGRTRQLSIAALLLVLSIAISGIIQTLNSGNINNLGATFRLLGIAGLYIVIYILHTERPEKTKIYPVE